MHPTTPIFDTNGHDFDTMSEDEKIPYLKIDRMRRFRPIDFSLAWRSCANFREVDVLAVDSLASSR